jgi:isoleucyl-tRNA synthetase
MPFVEDLSTWYLRRSRDRFKSEDDAGRTFAVETTGWILLSLSKLIAPFMPFLAEDLYRRLVVVGQKQSVHLENWPAIGVAPSTILEEMEEARKVVTRALEIRAKAGIKVRQPLASLSAPKLSVAMKTIVADEVNVKEVREGGEVELDTTITPELKEEGDMRDLVRTIQDLRKKAELNPSDRIVLTVPSEFAGLLEKYKEEILHAVGATNSAQGEVLAVSRI